MPWFSFHGGHSGQFCAHAKGTLADVVEAAIDRGFTTYGLTEHAPRHRVEHLYPEERSAGVQTLVDRFEAYIVEARALQARHREKIELLVGLETEWLGPDALQVAQAHRARGFDYIVGSVHDIEGRWIDYSAAQTRALESDLGGPAALQARYFEAVSEMVATLRPEVVGHLDLIRKFDGPQARIYPEAQPALRRALDAVADVGALLDVNCGAHRRGLSPVYPLPDILRQARQRGIAVTLGDDSHKPNDVGIGLDASVSAIAAAGYTHVSRLTRRDGTTALVESPLSVVAP